jgi:hypothetical protein
MWRSTADNAKVEDTTLLMRQPLRQMHSNCCYGPVVSHTFIVVETSSSAHCVKPRLLKIGSCISTMTTLLYLLHMLLLPPHTACCYRHILHSRPAWIQRGADAQMLLLLLLLLPS